MQSCKLVLLLLSVCVSWSVQDDLAVTVYYECLCPDSVNFVNKQLYPTYTAVKSLFQVELVPYGKAVQNRVEGKWVFQCQHGASECYGNKMQACALHQDVTLDKKMMFVDCIMDASNPSKLEYGEKCAVKAGIAWEPIRACTNSAIGNDYLAAMGDRTHALEPNLSFVPTVIFNNTYDNDLQWQSLKNFKKVVCQLQGNPDICA